MTETLLIVEPDPLSLRAMCDVLQAGRYRTLTAPAFGRALQLMDSVRPDLLITVVRLGKFNGLHLVVLGRATDPRMAALVVDDRPDEGLQREAIVAGATAYLCKPLSSEHLLARVAEALATRERRWWARTPLAGDVVIEIGAGTARLLDISYGGFRLESKSMHQHPILKLELPVLGLALNARRVWSNRTKVETVWSCGAALVAPNDSEATHRWRRLVDTIRGGVPVDPFRQKN
ncbi:MAG TPA: response regulator [Vicinamibacterales bacterium]|nr:response regulator [Vicinamibacterales bacterium]